MLKGLTSICKKAKAPSVTIPVRQVSAHSLESRGCWLQWESGPGSCGLLRSQRYSFSGNWKDVHKQPHSPIALPVETYKEPQEVSFPETSYARWGWASAGQWLCPAMSCQFGAICSLWLNINSAGSSLLSNSWALSPGRKCEVILWKYLIMDFSSLDK